MATAVAVAGVDTERQIRQMADFIELEAKEKAAEIRAKVRQISHAAPLLAPPMHVSV